MAAAVINLVLGAAIGSLINGTAAWVIRRRPRRGRQLANYLWTLHKQRPNLTLTVTVPELVYRNWWHRSLHEHVAERLQSVLQSLPRAVVTSVPLRRTRTR